MMVYVLIRSNKQAARHHYCSEIAKFGVVKKSFYLSSGYGTLWDYEPNWLIVRLIVQTYVGIVLLSILSAPFSPPKKIIQNWLTNTYHGILKPYYDVSQMIWIRVMDM